MRAAILSTGDELTTGRTLDTNANFIADQLIGVGVDVAAIVVVGDYPERIEWAWQMAFEQAEVVISTGGLGPTADDLTTETVGRLAGGGCCSTSRSPTASARCSRPWAGSCRRTT